MIKVGHKQETQDFCSLLGADIKDRFTLHDQ